ncbi:hypothetical protein [Paenibacillus sp. V4I5]|nr:hypothetical protein [Paenibacillus sp. V4I5]MDQ0921384.1 hypothetical protein [Paenibacillus sp. V4I5]
MKLFVKTGRMSLVLLDRSSVDLVLDYVIRNRTFLEPWELERNETY